MIKHRIDELFSFEKGTLQSSKCEPGKFDFITASSEWKSHKNYDCDCEALVFAAAASGSLGRTHYVNGKFIASDLCFILTPKDPEELPIDLKFYHIIFNTLRADIVKSTKAGTSKETIGLTAFGRYELPYFELERQIEIKNQFVGVEEVKNELYSEFAHQKEVVGLLRQAFLTEAMQGKVVKQNAKDEDAATLLKRLKAEKGIGLRNRIIEPVKEEEIPFRIPATWVWCRLGELLTEIKYGTSQSCDYDATKNSKVLRIPNISGGVINGEDLKYTNLNAKEQKELSLCENDILIIRSNGSRELVGKTVLVTSEFVGYTYAGYLVRFRFNQQFINPYFLWLATISPFFRDLIEKPLRTTVGINNINTEEMSNLLIPLAPLREQQRIEEKVKCLLCLCGELQENIEKTKQQNDTLLKQILREALELKEQEVEV